MKAGILREKIDIYKPNISTTDYGNTKIEYVYYKSTRAAVDYVSGTKELVNDENFHTITKSFILRYYNDITEDDRIKYEDRFWKINSIKPNKYYNDKVVETELVNE